MEHSDYITEMRGIIVEVNDCGVVVDFKGRLGQIKVPLRMVITDYPLEVAQEVGFRMSFLEVLFEKPNEKYLENVRLKNGRSI